MHYKKFVLLLLLFPVLIAQVVAASTSADWNAKPAAVADPIDGYHNFAALSAALQRAVRGNSEIARLSSLGNSLEGREIWMVEVGNRAGVATDSRPALLIVANLDGDQLVGSEISLRIIDYLIAGYGSDEGITKALDNSVFYIIPRANPDGAERLFSGVQTGQTTNMRPMDDDNDGRTDEDGPEDLNGDGLIGIMRVADAMGAYMVDPEEPRLMKAADAAAGESGTHVLYWEGIDSDGDGFYNEDPLGGVNLNRNFQHAYPYYQVGSGPHMISEEETRAIMDFAIAHRNISAVLTFGPHDNLVNAPNNKGELAAPKELLLPGFADASNTDARKTGTFATPRPRFFRRAQQDRTGRPSSGRRPETTVNKTDREYFTRVSEEYKKVTGLESLPATEKPAGALFEYGYYQFGVPSFSTPGWAPVSAPAAADSADAAKGSKRNDTAKKNESVDGEILKWMDAVGHDGFVEWSTYDHPTLGDVEIGGFVPYRAKNPPTAVIDSLGPRHGEFAVHLASLFPSVRVAKVEVTDHGGGVFRIEVEVENGGFFPTSTAHGVVSRSVKPTMVQLEVDPEALLSGDAKTSFFPALEGSGKRRAFEWIISGNRGETVTLRVVSQKGGRDTADIVLRGE